MVIEPGNSLNPPGGASSNGVARNRGTAERPAVKERQEPAAPAPAAGDNVSLSETGQTLARLAAAIEGEPAVDESRVAEVKAALANGSYRIDADAIAGKMLDQDGLF